MTTVHVVVPDGIDDPSRPSGGNVYDRRVCGGLATSGWTVHEHRATSRPSALADVLALVPDGGLVLVDGLVASAAAEVIVPRARRLRLVVLLHMPLGVGSEPARPRERAVLSAVASVVTTSRWARRWLLHSYALPPSRVRVVEPGAELAGLAPGSPTGGELLCVGAVTTTKGHDVLVAALAAVSELEWRCACVGALDLEPGFVDDVRRRAEASGIGDRLRFTGPLTGADLDAAYAGADVLLSASRAETYGMVVTEALAHGLPVVASAVGGLPEALGRADDGERPGLLVPPEDPHALAATLRHWLVDPEQRERLRKAAQARRLRLPDWSRTSRLLARVLDEALPAA